MKDSISFNGVIAPILILISLSLSSFEINIIEYRWWTVFHFGTVLDSSEHFLENGPD